MSRAHIEARLASADGFTDLGQIDRATRAWLGRQRRAGRVVQVAWCGAFSRPVWGWAAA